MQEKKEDSYNPLGICERLFNFIMNGIIASGFKRVTLGQPGSAVEHQSKSPSKLNGEVMPVHYLDHDNSKESEGLESWTPVGDEFGSSIYEPHQKDDAVLQSGKITSSTTNTTQVKHQEPKDKASETPRMKVKELQGKSFLDIEPNRIPVARPGGLKKTATVKDSAEEKRKSVEAKESTEDQGEKSRKKGKKISSSSRNPLTLAPEDEEIIKATSTPSPRTVRPFLGNNINEISDAFIRSRKAAMSRNH
ncbi:hypothetical protein Dsin_025218 [Dipteronia sinensis]|uniref:Uncharacterized protein n=1 Tax=Dipteronia sinensis TaxID=43782 RepID=A0AAD9Z5P2_9ROSI|nr:hypothetical protein Dsin_033164 [Dipteronia sinensis]KAK3193908.1 hypothetical protein Dsin_025218 [Dipteronia sinensis]